VRTVRIFGRISGADFWGRFDTTATRPLREGAQIELKVFKINGAGGGNRTHGLGIMRPSLYH
jgi:hypothetical protein